MEHKVKDLRSALELLQTMPGQLVETHREVDPHAELAGVYRYVGAGGTVQRPTQEGPAMLFHTIKGHPGAKVAIGALASRKRVAALLGSRPEDLGKLLYHSVEKPIPPVTVQGEAPCQQVVHRAKDPDFDLYKLVPAPTNTPDDAGPYITLGMCYATHPETGAHDVTIHRLCIQGKDELSIFFTPGARHIGAMAEAAERLGKPLPISISIGVDPAIEIGSCFEPPTTPLGYDELSVAGALRGEPVELCPCVTISAGPHHANLHWPQRGARLHGGHPHRGQHLSQAPNHRGDGVSSGGKIGGALRHCSKGVPAMEWDVTLTAEQEGLSLALSARAVGEDLLLCLSGGTRPHLGCVVMASPRPSLADPEKRSATSSVLNLPGHKDEALCRALAEQAAAALGRNVVCTGGVHVDSITPGQLAWLSQQVQQLGAQVLERFDAGTMGAY